MLVEAEYKRVQVVGAELAVPAPQEYMVLVARVVLV
jgi:hypothetical protein